MYAKKETLDYLIQIWQLEDLQHFGSFCNVHIYTASSRTAIFRSEDDFFLPVVIKINGDQELFLQEVRAFKLFQNLSEGSAVVRLLDSDADTGALLLERIIPGTSLKTCFPHDDLLSVRHICTLIKKLHNQLPFGPVGFSTLPTSKISDWLKDLQGDYPVLQPHLEKALILADILLKTQGPTIFLHGDLHHDNVLLGANNQWVAIDPKGALGEQAYEVGAFMRNPLPELLEQPDVKGILRARLELFSELLGLDKQRLKDWSYVQAVLAACWAIEDGVEYASYLAVAEILDEL